MPLAPFGGRLARESGSEGGRFDELELMVLTHCMKKGRFQWLADAPYFGTRSLTSCRNVIVERFPELAGSTFSPATRGFHSLAIDIDDRWIFKFPLHEEAARALRREARLLAEVRPAVQLRVPNLELFETPTLFSRHVKVRGSALERQSYEALPEAAKAKLALTLARFYADVHALDPARMVAAGAVPVEDFLDADQILREAWPLLPEAFRPAASAALRDWQDLPSDPGGLIYGYFDGHGWNMAFDHELSRLQGVFDFADSGIGPLHREFMYPSFVSFDLTQRIASEYEPITGRQLDRSRIFLMTGVFWLSELGGFAGQPEYLALAASYVSEWMAAWKKV